MRYLLIILIFSITFSQDNYIFTENIQFTDTSSNQKFPEMIINDGIIHLIEKKMKWGKGYDI